MKVHLIAKKKTPGVSWADFEVTNDGITWFPCLLESPGFFLENSRTWKDWKITLVLESPGN